MRRKLLIALPLLWPAAGLACSLDSECAPGSICLKASGSASGVCIGDLSVGNQSGQPSEDVPLDPSGTSGKKCSFDTDCGTGSRCVKSSTIDGVCIVGR
jgi:hypothetical protein